MTIEIVNLSDSPVEITNFDKRRYIDAEIMHKEQTAIWRNTWLLAGLVTDVAASGDYFVFDLGFEQILVTCDTESKIQGFYNVCQHRGNRLVGDERGHAQNFRCRYHSWAYDLAGELSAVPYEERFAKGVPCGELSLKKVHTECWGGFVFVHLGERPPALLEYLGPVAQKLAPYNFHKMTVIEDQTVTLNCNWKAVVDNFSELYHVDFLHPQHKRMVDCCNDTVHLFAKGHTGLAVPGATVSPRFPIPEEPTDIQSAQLSGLGLDPNDFVGRVLDIRRAVQIRKREVAEERGLDYTQLSDEQLSDVWQYNLFPNVIFSFTPDHLWVLRPRPHPLDPGRCEFDKISLVMFGDAEKAQESTGVVGIGRHYVNATGYRPEDYERPQRDVFNYDAVIAGEKTMTDTIDQDVELLGDVQAGMNSAGFQSTWLNDDEMRIQHFHNEWQRLIGSSLNDLPGES